MIADQSSKVVGAAVGNNGHLRHAQTPIVTAVLIGIMVLSFLVLCAWSIPYGDPIRDTNQAWLIAHGVELPLVGPPVAGVVNLGPVWWYLLAIPALFSSSMLGFSLFIGALAAAKFLLAWRLGERLVDSRTGLYLAAGLTIPSWNFWQFFFLTHAVLVEAALLGSLLLMVRYLERPTPWRAGVLGLVAGLGLHAHPTFVVAGFPLLLLWWAHGGPRKIATMHVLALVLMACVPFIPALLGQWSDAARHIDSVSRFAGSDMGQANLARVGELGWSLLVTGVQASLGLVFSNGVAHWLGIAWQAGSALMVVATIIAWRSASLETRRLLLGSLTCLVLAIALVALIRARTPWYMSWVLMPLLAGVYAGAMRALAECRPTRWIPPVSLAGLLIVQGVLVIGLAQRFANTSEMNVPSSSLFDVADTDLQWGELGLVVPSWRSGRLGRSLCEADVRGYGGILGKVLDERIGIDALLACGTRRDLEVGPCGDKARLGLPWSAWAALGTAPGEDVAVAGLALPGRAACLAGGPAIPMANGDEYPFRSYFPGEITKQSLAFQIPADRVLVVLNQFPVLNVMDELVVSADGHTMAPLWQDRATALFRCTDCSGNAEWRVSYRTVNTEQVYVIALDAD